jgi:Tfp pilus assembly protein PilF
LYKSLLCKWFLLLTLLLGALSGCWRVTGAPAALDPAQTLALALDARQRGDDRAAEVYLRRLLEEAPQSPEATLARALLLGAPRREPALLQQTAPYPAASAR